MIISCGGIASSQFIKQKFVNAINVDSSMIKEGLRKEILTILDSHKIRKKQKLRNSEYYNMTNILDNLYA